ncbi:MAG: hypothetical protein A2Z08_00155 [Deltaproteobacteria bacterium RBG_16_54_11]|nr:MAG: hypothetical protein A2Z08_00155 [Deltaproteobacteria bacterium RBG_16_54_11]
MRKEMWVLIAIILGLSSPCFGGDIQYKRYINARFAFGISYPEGILIPQGEADNGDGQKFISQDKKVEMLVYGYYNQEAEEYTLKYMFDNESEDNSADNAGRKVTYKKLTETWYVISGTEGDKIFYTKVFYRKKENQNIHFFISYPKSRKTEFDAITAEISKSFKLLRGPY